MKYQCRCNRNECRQRVTLNKHPLDYVNEKHCVCGGRLHVDQHRMTAEHKRVLCKCDGLPFPHRKGSSVWCREHPKGPTEQEYYERYKV